MFDISGKTAVVTGGTGVLGSVMAQGLAEAGGKVVGIGRRKKGGDALVNSLLKKNLKAKFVQADVLSLDDLNRAKKEFEDYFGELDILVNAAGGNMPGAVITPTQTFFDLNMEEFEKVVDLNLTGTV